MVASSRFDWTPPTSHQRALFIRRTRLTPEPLAPLPLARPCFRLGVVEPSHTPVARRVKQCLAKLCAYVGRFVRPRALGNPRAKR